MWTLNVPINNFFICTPAKVDRGEIHWTSAFPYLSVRPIFMRFFFKPSLSDLPINSNLFSQSWGSIGLYWMNLQTSEQSLPALSGIPLRTLGLAAMFRFIWADIRPENDLCGQEESSEPFCGRLDVLGSSVFISRLVTAARWSVSPQRPAGTVSRVTETDRRWTGEETCHRLTRLPAGGLHGTICFQLNR